MPRRNSAVKRKAPKGLTSLGAVDLHFHGAFGIDLMTARKPELDELSRRLWKAGVAAFCPTTLSTGRAELLATVSRLGAWIRLGRAPGAIPLGIHLEGPFIHPASCGAHPPGAIRRLSFGELEKLWTASQGTLRIITVAAERLTPSELKRLVSWSRKRRVTLSLGHSQATAGQAEKAFQSGFRGVTHAWNACGFHHRSPGLMGAALGNSKIYLELIIDQIHVSPEVARWTRSLQNPARLCFVSDATPAAALSGSKWTTFGPLRVRVSEGASRVAGGGLAGGGKLLPDMFCRWVESEAKALGTRPDTLLKASLVHLTYAPLSAIGESPKAPKLARKRVRWTVAGNRKIQVIPIDSASSSK